MILSQLRKSNIYTQLLRFSLVISLLVVCTSCTSISSNHTYTTHYPNSASLPAGNTPAFQGSNPSSPSSTVPSSRSAPVFTPPRTTTPSGATPGNATQNTTPSVPKPEPPQGQGTRNTTVVPARAPNAATVSELDLIMGPRTVIARPGSEVILTAGLRDRSGYLRTNQRIDWTISPQSVGHFSRIQERELTNFLVLDFVKPQIISDTQAVTTTSRSEIILDRGTPNLNDDIVVRRGESWVSVSSPREGMTIITARAPKVSGNQVQAQTSRIVWIDAAVKLPESRLLDFGSTYTLTTALRRVSDAQPLDRWRVRYEICNDSTAVFGDGNKMLEVYTNRDGEAKIEMRQPISREEETVVSVQIIRPAEGDFTEPVIVQDSKIHYRWTPNTINITKSMPKEAYIGDVVPAVISVTNLTDQELHNVRIVDLQQPGLVLKGAVPESQDAQDGRQWLVEKLAPHETYTIQLNYRVEQPGAYISFAQVQTQKLGNNLVVECSASLQAGSDTSPFTPEMPKKNLNGNGNPSENQSGNLGENSQNSIPSPTPTFVIDDKNHEKNSVADPFGNTTQPLPPPTDNSKDVYVPHVNTQQSTEKTDEKTTENGSEKDDEKDGGKDGGKDGNPSENTNENSGENTNGAGNFPVTPELPAPKLAPKEKPKKATNVYAKSPQRAQVLPKESPNAQITFNIDADAQVSLNQPFRVTITINNHTILPQTNVGILVANSRGLSNQSPSGDIYLIERNIRELPAQKQLRLRMDFMPVLPGDQVIEVKLMLSNGKEYRREARLFVREAENTTTPDVPPAIPPLTPNVQETQSTETPNTGTSDTGTSETGASETGTSDAKTPSALNLPPEVEPLQSTDSLTPPPAAAPDLPDLPTEMPKKVENSTGTAEENPVKNPTKNSTEIQAETPSATELPESIELSAETPTTESGALNALPDTLELPSDSGVSLPETSSAEPTPAPETEAETEAETETKTEAETDTVKKPKKSTKTKNRATRHPANPLPKTGSATVGTVLEQENEHGDPAFTITLKESKKKISVGDIFSYTLELINTSNAPVKQIELMLAFPPENIEIQKDDVAGPTEVVVVAGMVKYAPIPEIGPGQSVQYKVKVKATQAGTIQAHAQLLENGTPRSQKTCETTIEKKEE